MTHDDKPKPRPRRNPQPPGEEGDFSRHPASRDEVPPAPGTEPHERLAKIAGLQAVSALFRRDPSQVIRLYYEEKMKKAVGPLCAQMAKMQRPYRLVEESELQKLAGTVLHGGVVAAALPRRLAEFELEQARAWAKAGEPLLILDGVGNPHNLGAIARTLAYFGVKHLLLSDHPKQAGLSDAAHRVAEGGLECLDVWRVADLPQVCHRLQAFYRVVGTSLGRRAVDMALLPADPRPLALLLGNEEEGLPAATLDACEAAVVIRGTGQVQSLNVSATAAILIHQMAAQASRPRPPVEAAPGRRQGSPRPWQDRAKPRRG